MALPALENGPYVFNVNNKYTESTYNLKAQRAWLELKNALVALGSSGTIWDVVASSSSTALKNMNDSAPHDLWNDVGDIVGGTGDHSWVILENQTTGGQLCFDLYNASEWIIYVYYSYNGSYSTTDGSLSSRPSCSDEVVLRSTGGAALQGNANNLTCVINVMCSADRKTTRMYIHERNYSNGYLGGFYLAIEEAVNTPSDWIATYKTVVLNNSSTTDMSPTPYAQSPNVPDLGYETWSAYVKTATVEDWYSMWSTCECYGDLYSLSGAGTPVFRSTGELEIQGGPPVGSIGIYNGSSGVVGGGWGRLRDVFFGQAIHPTLTTYPNDSSRTWIKFGCFVVPWNGTIPVDALS